MHKERWLLPEGIDELLPEEAQRLEGLRRRLLDLHASWGYELVVTPFIEYLDSLLTGTGRDLDLQTFKLTDQISGRLLGVRADITPQAARIDAHHLRRDAPTRLCYVGSVLRTRQDGFHGSRSPLQLGAELYGHAGLESDVEILCLMMATLEAAGVADVYLDLGHVGVFRGLARQAGLTAERESALLDALQRKAIPELNDLIGSYRVDQTLADMLLGLAELNGGEAVIDAARACLKTASDEVLRAVDDVERAGRLLQERLSDVPLHFDLAELRGYSYHSGIVFAAFVPGEGQEVARGGRYDHIGEVFGRARAATGFSTDLKTIMRVGSCGLPVLPGKVTAPWPVDPALEARIGELRRQGWVVVRELSAQTGDAQRLGCTHRLEQRGVTWVLEAV